MSEVNTKLIRITSGEDIICDVLEVGDDYVTVSNPIVAVPAEGGKIAFAPWSPLMDEKESVTIHMTHVVYITKANPGIQEQYEGLFSSIVTPPKQGLIL